MDVIFDILDGELVAILPLLLSHELLTSGWLSDILRN